MVRTVGSNGERTREAILAAGIELIHACGYEAASLRRLAGDVGLQVSSLYNHFPSKQDLLVEIMATVLDDLLRLLDRALDGVDGPVERLKAFVSFHIHFHTSRRKEVFIGNMELRSLERSNYIDIVGKRGRYEAFVETILEDGNKAGVWKVEDCQVATYALIAMLTGVCTWYEPSGRLSREKLVEIHTGLALHGLGASDQGRE